ncbi:MAG: OmpA family protein [Bacteroidales bacterium]|nr:OmpA family protein [Bacteroidales bacterium]
MKSTYDTETAQLKKQKHDLEVNNKELNADITRLEKQNQVLGSENEAVQKNFRQLKNQHEQLQRIYDSMKEEYESKFSGSESETKILLTDLQQLREDLIAREDRLFKLEKELTNKEQILDKAELDLQEKTKRVYELQQILNRQDSAVNALRTTVADALFGFENKGLSVYQKNGKVYVSMENHLLFKSGSYQLASEGISALKKLSQVLEENSDINVLIEGHTDNVPYNGTGQLQDNWDLSVMRATAIVKIITNHSKVNPTRLTAAGKSEFDPIDSANTSEARKKNRRTEIILTPKMDELLKVLNN